MKPNPDRSPSFGSQWGLPVWGGCFAGIIVVSRATGLLVDQYGSVAGVPLAIVLGFTIALVATALCRRISWMLFRYKTK